MLQTTHLADPFAMSDDCLALVRRTGAPRWINAWMEAQGRGTLDVMAVHDDGGLAGIAAMHRAPDGQEVRTASWEGLVADREDVRTALASALIDRGRRRMGLQFGYPGTSGFEAVCGAARRPGSRVMTVPYLRSPFVDTTGDWLEYVERHRLKSLDRGRNRLRQQGELVFEIHDGRDGLDDLLDAGFALEAVS